MSFHEKNGKTFYKSEQNKRLSAFHGKVERLNQNVCSWKSGNKHE